MKRAFLIAGLFTLAASPVLAKKPVATPSWLVKAHADCVERVVSEYGVVSDKIKLGKNHDDAKDKLNIPGKVNKGAEGIKSFMCKFNEDGALVDVMSMTSDGKL